MPGKYQKKNLRKNAIKIFTKKIRRNKNTFRKTLFHGENRYLKKT